VIESSEHGGFRLDWIFHLPLYLARGELFLRRREFSRARQDALLLCDLAARPGQRTYLASARRILSQIALAQGDNDEAESQIALAREVLENAEAPLAEWRVFATSAEIARRNSHPDLAAACNARAMAVVERIATSLSENEAVRQSLLSAPEIQSVLRPAARGTSTGRD